MNTGIWKEKWKEYRWPFLCAVLVGLLAFAYFFTNKLPNFDDVAFTFSKGAELESGRWGLEICELLFPNYSMPWLWGILSLILMGLSACVILDLFQFKNLWVRCLLAGLLVVFPSQLSTFTYMFTSSSYALAFLLTVLSVWIARNADKFYKYIISTFLLVLALGIYQSNIAVAAGLFVLLMISDSFRGEKTVRESVFFGLRALACLAVSVLVYFGVTLLLLSVRGESFGGYAQDAIRNPESIGQRLFACFRSFVAVFVPNYRMYGLVTSPLSAYVHIAAAAASMTAAVVKMVKEKKWVQAVYTVLLTVIVFPLSLTCMLFTAGNLIVHTLVMYSFVLVYFLLAIFIDCKAGEHKGFIRILGKITCVGLGIIIACNVVEANRAALAEQFEYENTRALYTTVASQVQSTEGFDDSTRIAIVGEAPVSEVMHSFGWSEIMGVMGAYSENAITLRNAWSREDFIRYFLGFDWNFASAEEVGILKSNAEVTGMPSYPYNGYVKRIGDFIVVKLSK